MAFCSRRIRKQRFRCRPNLRKKNAFAIGIQVVLTVPNAHSAQLLWMIIGLNELHGMASGLACNGLAVLCEKFQKGIDHIRARMTCERFGES